MQEKNQSFVLADMRSCHCFSTSRRDLINTDLENQFSQQTKEVASRRTTHIWQYNSNFLRKDYCQNECIENFYFLPRTKQPVPCSYVRQSLYAAFSSTMMFSHTDSLKVKVGISKKGMFCKQKSQKSIAKSDIQTSTKRP